MYTGVRLLLEYEEFLQYDIESSTNNVKIKFLIHKSQLQSVSQHSQLILVPYNSAVQTSSELCTFCFTQPACLLWCPKEPVLGESRKTMRKYVLDLSEIYCDHRRKAYLGHRPTWTTIRSMIQTLKVIFGIDSHVHVCSAEEIFYPDSESVEILRDGETLKIIPDSTANFTQHITDSEEDNSKVNETNNQLESTFEDIQSILCSLPKPKRRRVRKRKSKKPSQGEHAHRSPSEESGAENGGAQEKSIHFSNTVRADEPASVIKRCEEEEDRPYRNLNRQMKARVVRAVSLSTLNTPPSDEVFVHPPSVVNGTAPEKSLHGAHSGSQSSKKARVVRAVSLENTVEIKRELLEVCSTVLNAETTETAEKENNGTEREVSVINDMETYSTIVSDV